MIDYREKMIENFEFIQCKIDEIKKEKEIDIKQISDLQRYINMQANISTIVKNIS